MSLRLEDCTETQRRLLLALVANRKAAEQRNAETRRAA